MSKLAEGCFNRTFVITLRDGRQILAQIPYPAFVPRNYAVTSEVATIEYLRSRGIPAPEIYGYSADLDNAAGTPYIFMEFVQGSQLGEVMFGLSNQEVVSVLRQLAELESRMMSLSFPAGGSLYFANDLEKIAPGRALQPSNILVSRSPDSGWKIVGLSEWTHTSILPMFLLAGVPRCLHIFGGVVPEPVEPPSLPDDFDTLSEPQQAREKRTYAFGLVHYNYVTSTKECNQPHYAALTDPLYALRGRLFQYAGAPWEGESADLKVALIEATKRWEEFTGGGVACPLEFDAEDLRETAALDKDLDSEDRGFAMIQSMGGVGEDGLVLNEDYEFSVSFLREIKEGAIESAQSAEDRECVGHWPWDDMDEAMYM
ncbi:hypothetical protein MD484_g6715, partial [Candolleomyces efflorescens]